MRRLMYVSLGALAALSVVALSGCTPKEDETTASPSPAAEGTMASPAAGAAGAPAAPAAPAGGGAKGGGPAMITP